MAANGLPCTSEGPGYLGGHAGSPPRSPSSPTGDKSLAVDHPQRIARLEANSLWPLQGGVKRYLMSNAGYNGRVERNHRTDDEEFH